MPSPMMYVDEQDGWLLVSGPASLPPPLRIAGYEPFGTPRDCVREVYRFLADAPYTRQNGGGAQSAPLQQMIADHMRVSQRSVSNWISRSDPDLYKVPADGVLWLIRTTRYARVQKGMRKRIGARA